MKVIPLTIGAWNVRTLMDSSGSDRPQRRTALVGRELDQYKVEIAALSKTCLAEEALLKEVGAGYTFFWSGRKKEERREAGVGFAIKELYIDPNLDFLRWAQIFLLRMFCVLLPYNCELKGISASYADNPTMEYLSMEFLRSYANF